MKVEQCNKKYFASIKEVVEVDENDKMIKTLFSTKSTYH